MDLEGGVFSASKEYAPPLTGGVSSDPEDGRSSNHIPDDTAYQNQHRVVSARTVKTMQWFNPSHIEQMEHVNSKLQSSQKDSSKITFSSSTTEDRNEYGLQKPPSQAEFRKVKRQNQDCLVTPLEALSIPRPVVFGITKDSITSKEHKIALDSRTLTTSYAAPCKDAHPSGASAIVRAAYINYGVKNSPRIDSDYNETSIRTIPVKVDRADNSPVWSGSYLWKIPFNNDGIPRIRWFRTVHDVGNDGSGIYLKWTDPQRPRKAASELAVSLVKEIVVGQVTNAFFKQVHRRGPSSLPPPALSFSLITETRTLDLAATDKKDYDNWVKELRKIINEKRVDNSRPRYLKPLIDERRVDSGRISNFAHVDKTKHVGDEVNNNLTNTKMTNEALRRFWRDTLFDHCRHNRLSEVQTIMNEGCPIDLMERETGDTALMVACRRGRTHIVRFCLGRGAKNDPHPQYGQTALQAAVASGHHRCAQVILETAKPHNMDVVIVNHADPMKDSPLHIAARRGDIQTMEVLLRHGADYKLVDSKGCRPLHLAASNSMYKAVALFVDVVDNLDVGEYNGNTALHLAATVNDPAVVKLLLDSAADPRCINIENKTPLNIAMELRHDECAHLLKKGMADVLGTPRPEPFLSRCLKPGEEETNGARPMFKPSHHSTSFASANIPQGYVSDYRTAAVNTNANRNRSIADNSPDIVCGGFQSRLFDGLDVSSNFTGVQQRHHNPYDTTQESYANSRTDSSNLPYSNNGAPASASLANYDSTNNYFIETRWSDTGGAHELSEYDDSGALGNDNSIIYVYTDARGAVWEYRYTEEGYPYFFNTQSGTSQWEDPCPEGYDGWHESNWYQWGKWHNHKNDDDTAECNGQYQAASSEPHGTITQKVRAQLARRNCAKSPDGAQSKTEHIKAAWSDFSTDGKHTKCKKSIENINGRSPTNEEVLRQGSPVHNQIQTTEVDITKFSKVPQNSNDTRKVRKPQDVQSQSEKDYIDDRMSLQAKPELQKFFKMRKMGIPIGAVAHKMTLDGIPSEIILAFRNSNNSQQKESTLKTRFKVADQSALRDNDSMNKYFKMKKMGIPLGAIRQKMVKDGISESSIAAFCKEAGTTYVQEEKQQSTKADTLEKLKSRREEMKRGKEYEKYFKMEKMGIPLGAIKSKMSMDQLSVSDISAFCLELNKQPPPPPASEKSSLARKMMKLHWEKIPHERLRNTVWGKVDANASVEKNEVDQLTKLFGAKTPRTLQSSSVRTATKASKRNTKFATRIDSKRLRNIEIGLAQFRNFETFSDIINAVCTMDENNLPVLKLEALYSISPSATETLVFKKIGAGSLLGKAEQWLMTASKIPRFIEKVDIYRFKLNFNDRAKELARNIQLLSEVCKKVKQSKKLMSVLENVLSIGNLMNKGTHKGGAAGFKLNSLMKLIQTKSHDKKTTILDFLVQSTLESKEESRQMVLNFPDELTGIENAVKIDVARIKRDFFGLKTGVEKMKREVDTNVEILQLLGSPRNEIFASLCKEFVETVATKVLCALSNAMEDVTKESSSVVAYFGEDPENSTANQIFEILYRFSNAYRSAVRTISERLRRKRRAAERKMKRKDSDSGKKLAAPRSKPPNQNHGISGKNALLASIKAGGGLDGLRQAAKIKEISSPRSIELHQLRQSLLARTIESGIPLDDAKSLVSQITGTEEHHPFVLGWLKQNSPINELLGKLGMEKRMSVSETRAAECRNLI